MALNSFLKDTLTALPTKNQTVPDDKTTTTGEQLQFLSNGGIAVAMILGVAVLGSTIYLAWLLRRKLQDRAEGKQQEKDAEALLETEKMLKTMKRFSFEQGPSDDGPMHTIELEKVERHSPTRPKARSEPRKKPAFLTIARNQNLPVIHTPRETFCSSERSPTSRSGLLPPPATRANTLHSPRHAPLSPLRQATAFPTRSATNIETQSPNISSPVGSSFDRIRRGSRSQPEPLSGRLLSQRASAAMLMNHPSAQGRRVSEIAPGLDPEYPYPMTPGQIGDGRSLDFLGRRPGLESLRRKSVSC
jgi:hypothetical protein